MRLFQNPEIRRFLRFFLPFAALAAGGGFFLSPTAACYVLLVCLALLLAFLFFLQKRYPRRGELSALLGRLLHEGFRADFVPDEEGELALLTSQIYKMTCRLREQAEAATSEKGRLKTALTDISHQLRTPLTAMHLILSRLQRETLSEDARRDLILELLRLLTQMEWLISALLKSARLESGTIELTRERVSLRSLLTSALRPLEIPLELKEGVLDLSIEGNPSFLGDPSWSAEAVGNVLKNCMEHLPTGGRIKIRASENPLYAELTVSDSGNGIPPEELPHLFDRFYRGENAGPDNAGIGLSLARAIVARQNGVLFAQTPPEGGAKFTFRFYRGDF